MLLSDIAELKMPRERKAPERFQHDQSHVTGAERAQKCKIKKEEEEKKEKDKLRKREERQKKKDKE